MTKIFMLEGMFMLVVEAKHMRMIELEDVIFGIRFRIYRCVLHNDVIVEVTIAERDMAQAYNDAGALGIMREVAKRILTITRRN